MPKIWGDEGELKDLDEEGRWPQFSRPRDLASRTHLVPEGSRELGVGAAADGLRSKGGGDRESGEESGDDLHGGT